MIGEYTCSELTDMHIMFARAYRSTLQAQRLCQEDFPGHGVPDKKKHFLASTSVFFTITMQLPRTNVTEQSTNTTPFNHGQL
jgi:hypothetical protein